MSHTIRRAAVVQVHLTCTILLALHGGGASAQSRASPVGGTTDIRQAIDRGQYGIAAQVAGDRVRDLSLQLPPDAPELFAARDLWIETFWRNGVANPDARAAAERLVDDKRRAFGADHPALIQTLENLGRILLRSGDNDPAAERLAQAVRIADGLLPRNDLAVAAALDAYGAATLARGRFEEARQVLDRALRLKLSALSSRDIEVARTHETLAQLMLTVGDYRGARPHVEEAVSIRAAAMPEHPEFAGTLSLQGDLLWFEGNVREAFQSYDRAVRIATATLRPLHPDIARYLRNSALALDDMGDIALALSLRQRAAAIVEADLGADHPAMVAYLNDLANSFLAQGDYARARALYDQGLSIHRRRYGPGDAGVATLLHNLALVNGTLGDFAAARRQHDAAVAIWQRQLGPDHPFVAVALSELAAMLVSEGRPADAVVFYRRALAIRERILGADHVDVARSLAGMADALVRLKRFREAEPLSLRALDIWTRSDQEDAPGLAAVLALRADVLRAAGRLPEARTLGERALRIRQRAFGAQHPQVAETDVQLARISFELQDRAQALREALDAETLGVAHLRSTIRYLPERQALRYAAKRPSGLSLALSVLRSGAGRDEAGAVLDALVRSRAATLDEMAARRHSVLDSGGPELRALAAALVSSRERLANLVVRDVADPTPHDLELLERARTDRELAERALAEKSSEFRAELARAEIGLDEVRTALPPASAVVSFVRYEQYQQNLAGRGVPGASSARYGAFILRAGEPTPVFVPLSTATTIDAAVTEWRRAAAFGTVRNPTLQEAEAAYRAVGRQLARLTWQPLAAHIEGAARIFVVPDGSLNLVNFSALPVGAADYLVTAGPLIHYLAAERDLVVGADRPLPGGGLLALGGPTFDAAPSSRPAAPGVRRDAGGCGSFQGLRFGALPATLKEVTDVTQLWRAAAGESDPRSIEMLTGDRATERAFKSQAAGHGVLHLATHGFFLGECEEARGGTRGVGGLTPAGVRPRSRGIRDENPLLLSGLALAGANRRSRQDLADDDGILTAEEIAALNLEGTQWAVLSACDTGLGAITSGEGVLGLRRAFQVAGARTVIMSLWPVEDDATRGWMRALYRARLEPAHRDTAESVRAASLAMLNARRARGLSTHPFYWAAFVAAGDWR